MFSQDWICFRKMTRILLNLLILTMSVSTILIFKSTNKIYRQQNIGNDQKQLNSELHNKIKLYSILPTFSFMFFG